VVTPRELGRVAAIRVAPGRSWLECGRVRVHSISLGNDEFIVFSPFGLGI
jgi:hypothetical protein